MDEIKICFVTGILFFTTGCNTNIHVYKMNLIFRITLLFGAFLYLQTVLFLSLPNRASILTPIDGLEEGEEITMRDVE